mmetsp:Transcript_18948/g.48096  ORF Transcript_18948/g.48096 Transcript_18948/m.48096 type:complete len:91 (-) Transcript_18948:2457-2729(-)
MSMFGMPSSPPPAPAAQCEEQQGTGCAAPVAAAPGVAAGPTRGTKRARAPYVNQWGEYVDGRGRAMGGSIGSSADAEGHSSYMWRLALEL